MNIKINYKNSAPKFVNSMIFGKIILVTNQEDATEFQDQDKALSYLSLIIKHIGNMQDDVIKSIEFIEKEVSNDK